MKKNLKIIYRVLVILCLINFYPLLVKADTTKYIPLAPLNDQLYGSSGGVSFTGDKSDLSLYINNMYKLAVGVAGILAVLMIMWGGIEYMSTDAIGGKEEAKGRINNALLGLFIALGSFLLLKTINQEFLSNELDIKSATAPELEKMSLETYVGSAGTRGGSGEKNAGSYSGSSEGGGGDGTIKGSYWNNEEWKNYATEYVESHPELLSAKPSDASNWIDSRYINADGTVQTQGWVNLLAGITLKESSFNPNETYTEKFTNSKGQRVESVGLLSMSEESAKGYGYNYTTEQLKDPQKNLQVGTSILAKWVSKDGVISGSNNTGAARFWSVVRKK